MTTPLKGCSRCLHPQIVQSRLRGDLVEEREQRGWIWFWLHVVSVTLALWRSAATEAPLRVLALVLAGLALLTAPALGGVAAVFSFQTDGFAPGLDRAAVLLVGWGALDRRLFGRPCAASRHGGVRDARRGGEALLIGFGGPAVWRDPSNTSYVLFCTTGLIAAMPLLTGAAVARRRLVA